MLQNVAQWLFPNICILCESVTECARDLCVKCEAALPWISDRCFQCGLVLEDGRDSIYCNQCRESPPKFDRLCALFSYEFPVDGLITGLKFGEKLVYGRVLGELLANKIEKVWYKNKSLPEAIIPIPLHVARLRKRGFNQALELSLPVKKKLKIPLLLNACKRIKKTKPQSSLNRERRDRNLKGVFEVVAPLQFDHIAIVDDVVTTGSTVNALSTVLKEAGVSQVDIWCICRA